MTRRTLTAIFLTLTACAVAFGQTNVEAARAELSTGARMYRDGDFAAAEQHFRRAHELDPSSKNAPIFIARAVQQQYKPGVQTPENIAVGEKAIAEYQTILAKAPKDKDTFKAIVFLYAQMKNDDKVRELLTERANNFSIPNEQRAEVLIILASRQWQCAYNITEQNKETFQGRGSEIIHFKKPKTKAEVDNVQNCATEGLRLIEQAIILDPNNPNAWSQKANLFSEMSKLSEMKGDSERITEYKQKYGEAYESYAILHDEKNSGDVSQSSKVIVSGGLINSKAISKPQPRYPAIALAARAQGKISIQIIVDEEGKVISAFAISGHPLLRQAAEEASRNARFTPTLLEEQPVKVRGVITYNFVIIP